MLFFFCVCTGLYMPLCFLFSFKYFFSTKLVRQQIELLATEGVTLKFEDSAIREIARIVAVLNRTVENIGARRIHTAMERIMEQLSFDCTDMEPGTVLTVDKKLVEERLSDAAVSNDLSRYIL